jgi:hypothetical protein
VTDELHDFFTMLRFQTQYWEKEFDWSDLPPDFPRLLKMNFERLSAGHMKQQTGLNRRVAKRHLLSALSNFYKRADGRTYLQHRLSREEQTIVSSARAGPPLAPPSPAKGSSGTSSAC